MSKGNKRIIQLSSSLLAVGASLSLGLLAFGGIWIFLPVFSLGFATFALSVIYEGEIYQKNIFRALLKLNNRQFMEQKIAEEFLEYLAQNKETLALQLEHLKKNKASSLDIHKLSRQIETYDIAKYFHDYAIVLDQLSQSESEELRVRQQQMEIFIGQQLLNSESSNSKLAKKLKECFDIHQIKLDELKQKVEAKKKLHFNIKIFSVIASALMSIGSIYLLLEALEILTFISISAQTLPFIIIPLSILVGISYGFLTYNSLTDFLLNESLNKWLKEIYADMQSEDVFKNGKKLFFIMSSLFVLILNLTLTLCTAGTWWTLINQDYNSWKWLSSWPMKVVVNLISIVIAVATLCFNLENTIETINEMKSNKIGNDHKHQIIPETTWQKWNPFRALLKVTYVPLRLILFLGHLLSISLTSDRMPGVPPFVSVILGFLSEGLEDGHYFLDFKNLFSVTPEESECNHDNQIHEHSDLPNQILQTLFIGLFYAAAYWHYSFQSQSNYKSFETCLDFYLGKKPNKIINDNALLSLSSDWLKQEILMNCDDELNRLNACVVNPTLVQEKKHIIEQLKKCETPKEIQLIKETPSGLGTHRLFESTVETSSLQCFNHVEQKLLIASIRDKLTQKNQHCSAQELHEFLEKTTPETLNNIIDNYNPKGELNFASRKKMRTETFNEFFERTTQNAVLFQTSI